MPNPEVLGWSGGHDKHGDPTGIAHLQVVDEGQRQARPALRPG
jgi:hypothetical protein